MTIIKERIKRLLTVIEYEREKRIVKSIINNENFAPIKNQVISGKKMIFLLPNIIKGAGGITSVLRLGTYLYEDGYEVTFAVRSSLKKEELLKNAYFNLASFKGNIETMPLKNSTQYDIVVATDWKSVYDAKKMQGYKLYFVQDYEPYFFKMGELYILAKKTYEFGFHMISLGKWNKEKIIQECRPLSEINSISFPYEPGEYETIVRNYDDYCQKRQLNIAVYIKENSKRLPVIIPIILDKLYDLFLNSGIKLNIYYFGNEKHLNIKYGNVLGRMSKLELSQLYNKCDFGMVASMTNISLVPLEMAATGLPLIEFEDGSFPSFFEDDSCILCNFQAEKLYRDLEMVITNPDKLKQMCDNMILQLSKLSWRNTAREFADILKNIS